MQVFELPVPNNPLGSRLYGPKVLPEAIAFSPDGRLIAAWNRGGVYVIDTTTGDARTLWDKRDIGMTEVPGIGFTADGKGIVADHDLYPAELWVHDVETGAIVRKLPFKEFSAVEPGPQGFFYAGVYYPDRVEVIPWNPITGETKSAVVRYKGSLRQLAISADEKWMAGSSSKVIRVWNRSSPKPSCATRQITLESSVACVTALCLSSDGAFVAAAGDAVGVQVWDVKSGEAWQPAKYSATFAREIAFHSSRPLLAFSGRTTEVAFWDAISHTEVRRFAWEWGLEPGEKSWRSETKVLAVTFSPDGLRCAAACNGKVVVWDVDV